MNDEPTQMFPNSADGTGDYPQGAQQYRPQQYPPPQQPGPVGGYSPYPQQGGQEKQGTSPWLVAIVVLGVVLVLLLVGLVVFQMLRSDSSHQSGVGTVTAPQQAQGAAPAPAAPPAPPPPPAPAPAPPAGGTGSSYGAPSWAAAVDTGYSLGTYKNTYKSGPTSNTFARAVRDSFVSHYISYGSTNATLNVYSAVTGHTYTMYCSDQGSHVHCSGGNNANVYLY